MQVKRFLYLSVLGIKESLVVLHLREEFCGLLYFFSKILLRAETISVR